jgi:hypothetical protein
MISLALTSEKGKQAVPSVSVQRPALNCISVAAFITNRVQLGVYEYHSRLHLHYYLVVHLKISEDESNSYDIPSNDGMTNELDEI